MTADAQLYLEKLKNQHFENKIGMSKSQQDEIEKIVDKET